MILATWLPFAFIGRIMFLYHFFPTLAFYILTIVAFIKMLNDQTKYNAILIAYILIVIAVFMIFYPVTSGMTVSKEYVESIKWLKTWTF